jgi:hypothetical protein
VVQKYLMLWPEKRNIWRFFTHFIYICFNLWPKYFQFIIYVVSFLLTSSRTMVYTNAFVVDFKVHA